MAACMSDPEMKALHGRLAQGWSPARVSGLLRLKGHPVTGRQWTCRHVHADRRAGLWRNLRRRGTRPNRNGRDHMGRVIKRQDRDDSEQDFPTLWRTCRLATRSGIEVAVPCQEKLAWDDPAVVKYGPCAIPAVFLYTPVRAALRLPSPRLQRERRRARRPVFLFLEVDLCLILLRKRPLSGGLPELSPQSLRRWATNSSECDS